MSLFRFPVLLFLIYLCCVECHPHGLSTDKKSSLLWTDPVELSFTNNPLGRLTRHRRGFDLILGAEHEQNVGTDVSVEALLNVWKSDDENTRVDASATYNQRFGVDNINGNARFGGKLTFHYD